MFIFSVAAAMIPIYQPLHLGLSSTLLLPQRRSFFAWTFLNGLTRFYIKKRKCTLWHI